MSSIICSFNRYLLISILYIFYPRRALFVDCCKTDLRHLIYTHRSLHIITTKEKKKYIKFEYFIVFNHNFPWQHIHIIRHHSVPLFDEYNREYNVREYRDNTAYVFAVDEQYKYVIY